MAADAIAVSDGQSLEKLANATDNIAGVISRNIPIAHGKTNETNSLAERIGLNLNISEKLNT